MSIRKRLHPIVRVVLLVVILIIVYVVNKRTINTSVNPNSISAKEKEQGWQLLWDGKSFNGWRAIYESDFPKTGWIVENDALVCLGTDLPDSLRGGAIITEKKYKNFELVFDFKIKSHANSGVKYFINEELKASPGHGLGLEYAILDDSNWPYDKPDYFRTMGSLYDMVKATNNKPIKPLGEWNHGRIVVNGNHLEHWLNGMKVVEIEKSSQDYYERLAVSKYRNFEGWGEFPDGHILIQDEGPRAEFRNIKIRIID